MDEKFYRASMKIGGGTVFGRVALTFLVICAACLGAAIGLLFVYSSDLPEIRALENYRPDIVTELYADDGQSIGTFALQRRILLTYNQIPKVLKSAILTTEDQHFEEHWGLDFPRILQAAWHDILRHRIREGASTLTMQLAGGLFLNRADRSFHRKIQETILALEIERHYTKDRFSRCTAIRFISVAGTYGFEAASEYYFGQPDRAVDSAASGDSGRDHSRAGLFACPPSGPRARAPESGALADGARPQNHAGSRLPLR